MSAGQQGPCGNQVCGGGVAHMAFHLQASVRAPHEALDRGCAGSLVFGLVMAASSRSVVAVWTH